MVGGAAHCAETSGDTLARVRAQLDAIPAIHTHSHLHPWPMLSVRAEGMFGSVPRNAYTNPVVTLPARAAGESTADWWRCVHAAFANVRATGFYRFKLAAFRDLYGVDLEQAAAEQIDASSACMNAESIYPATLVNRAVIAEVLAEKIDRGDLREADALRIGRQILRENALVVYPGLRAKLWKHRARMTPEGLLPLP